MDKTLCPKHVHYSEVPLYSKLTQKEISCTEPCCCSIFRFSTYVTLIHSEFEDFYVPQAYIHFEVGSRGGQQATALVNITDDQVAEAFEEFSIYIISTDETVAVIKGDSTVTISIVDDDGES